MESCRCSRAFFSIWVCKKTRALWPFQMFFPLVFPSAGFTPWSKNSHERGKGKGKGIVKEGKGKNRKGRGKGKEKERKRKRKRKGRKKGKRTGKKKKEKGMSKGRDRKRERKGRGKGRGKGKKKAVSHTDDFLMPKVIVFVIVLWSFVNPVCVPFFLEMAAIIKKECGDHLPGTFLVQNLRHYDNKQWKEETKSTK